LAGTKSNHTAGADGNLLARFGVSPGSPILVAQIEIAEAGEFHLLARRQCRTDFLEKQVHQLSRFTLVEAQLIEKGLGHLGLGQGCHAY